MLGIVFENVFKILNSTGFEVIFDKPSDLADPIARPLVGLGMRFLQNPLQRCASWGTLILLYTAKIAEMNELDR